MRDDNVADVTPMSPTRIKARAEHEQQQQLADYAGDGVADACDVVADNKSALSRRTRSDAVAESLTHSGGIGSGSSEAAALAELYGQNEPPRIEHEAPVPSMWTWCTSWLTLLYLVAIALVCEAWRRVAPAQDDAEASSGKKGSPRKRRGYALLVKDFDDLWNRHFYRRIRDCWNRPIDSRPSRIIGVMERVSHDHNATFEFTGRIVPAINMSSYNYLGFAEDTPCITRSVIDNLACYGTASCSAPHELGQNATVAALEKEFAAFVGKDDAVVCGMGFGTNYRGLPSLFGRETLVLSDRLNHRSLVNGVRASGATVRPFDHDDYDGLETLLRNAVVCGRDARAATYQPWRRIVIVVEGVYSMEGEIVDLQRIVALKKKYKALLFVDEAHSIGALGRTGRGVCEYCGVPPSDVDVLMGTFTKSFGAIGGYIAADQRLIDYLRLHSSITLHCDALAPACAQQILSVLHVLLGKDGTDLGRKRIHQLKENSRFLRRGLQDLGLTVLGDDSSPVVPVMCYNGGKLPVLSRKCLERGLAIVVVGYPATGLIESRIRFCVSASHTREDLQYTLDVMKELCEEVQLQFKRKRPFHLPV